MRLFYKIFLHIFIVLGMFQKNLCSQNSLRNLPLEVTVITKLNEHELPLLMGTHEKDIQGIYDIPFKQRQKEDKVYNFSYDDLEGGFLAYYNTFQNVCDRNQFYLATLQKKDTSDYYRFVSCEEIKGIPVGYNPALKVVQVSSLEDEDMMPDGYVVRHPDGSLKLGDFARLNQDIERKIKYDALPRFPTTPMDDFLRYEGLPSFGIDPNGLEGVEKVSGKKSNAPELPILAPLPAFPVLPATDNVQSQETFFNGRRLMKFIETIFPEAFRLRSSWRL